MIGLGQPLSGGEVLLSVDGARWALRSVVAAMEAQARNRLACPAEVLELREVLRAAVAAGQGSASASAEVPRVASGAPCWEDPIDTTEAAHMLQISARRVRAMCNERKFPSADQDSAGRWLVERADVLERKAG